MQNYLNEVLGTSTVIYTTHTYVLAEKNVLAEKSKVTCGLSERSQRHVHPGRCIWILYLALTLVSRSGKGGTRVGLSLPDCGNKPRYLESSPSLGIYSVFAEP